MDNPKMGLSAFALKIIAIITMTFCHIAQAFGTSMPIYLQLPLYAVGGLTFPIMAYLMIEGYKKTSNVKKYMMRLLFFGLIALVPYVLASGRIALNILFTFLFGLICLYLHDKMKNKTAFWFCFAGITIFTIFCDWAVVGVPMILMFGIIKKPKLRIILPIIITSLVMTLSTILMNDGGGIELLLSVGFNVVVLCSIPLLQAYNGKRGYSPRSLRYLFYVYYPAHLIVIAVIKLLLP